MPRSPILPSTPQVAALSFAALGGDPATCPVIALDRADEWVGYEAAHPLTWLPPAETVRQWRSFD